ncbi:MAG: hypothetical protein JNK82_08120 [Myxococcaceae bacterium]|nr:hypothetical protein [Myxococcaceae bacterium]
MPPIRVEPRVPASTPPPHLNRAVERLLDNEALRGDLTDDEYGPLLDRAVRQLEAAARGGAGPAFERKAQAITDALRAAVARLESAARLTDNGSSVFQRLSQAGATLDAREAQALVDATFTTPMRHDNFNTLVELFAAGSNTGVALPPLRSGEPFRVVTLTPAAYQVLAQAVGFQANEARAERAREFAANFR